MKPAAGKFQPKARKNKMNREPLIKEEEISDSDISNNEIGSDQISLSSSSYSSSDSSSSESSLSSSSESSSYSSESSSSESSDDGKHKRIKKRKIEKRATGRIKKIFDKIYDYASMSSGQKVLRLMDSKTGPKDMRMFVHLAQQMLKEKQYHGMKKEELTFLAGTKVPMKKKKMLLTAKPGIMRSLSSYWDTFSNGST